MGAFILMADLGLSPVSAAAAAFTAVLGIVGVLGICVVWLRRSISTERDRARVTTIAALREVADVEERLSEAKLAEYQQRIDRLERHHDVTHRRCLTGPQRDG